MDSESVYLGSTTTELKRECPGEAEDTANSAHLASVASRFSWGEAELTRDLRPARSRGTFGTSRAGKTARRWQQEGLHGLVAHAAMLSRPGVGVWMGLAKAAGGDEASPYIIATEPPVDPPAGPPGSYAVLSGSGDGVTDRFTLGAPIEVSWYAADPEGASCDMRVTLMPADVDMGSARGDGWAAGGGQWSQGAPADRNAAPALSWIKVRSDCSWSLRAHVVMS